MRRVSRFSLSPTCAYPSFAFPMTTCLRLVVLAVHVWHPKQNDILGEVPDLVFQQTTTTLNFSNVLVEVDSGRGAIFAL